MRVFSSSLEVSWGNEYEFKLSLLAKLSLAGIYESIWSRSEISKEFLEITET